MSGLTYVLLAAACAHALAVSSKASEIARGAPPQMAAVMDSLGSVMMRKEENSKNLGSTVTKEGVINCDTARDAKPGTPHLDGLTNIHLKTSSKERAALGDRVVKAADASVAAKACGYFYAFGDYSWCDKAMLAESSFAHENKYPVHVCPVSGDMDASLVEARPKAQDPESGFLALSYGVFTSDPWSELMSNMYFLKTKLHDCYYKGDQGPLANDLHSGFSTENQCKGRHCYSVPYEAKRVCIGETGSHDGRNYESLTDHLRDQGPLSTFIKMDVEGAEWTQLEKLLENEEDMNKIRSLDMEVHFNMDPDKLKHGDESIEAMLERKVRIMEKLAKQFAVTGSTLEPLFKKQHATFVEDNEKPQSEPLIHTSKGYGMTQYCISFINRKLL